MWCFCVLEKKGGPLFPALSFLLRARGFEIQELARPSKPLRILGPRRIVLMREDEESEVRPLSPHLIVAPPEAECFPLASKCQSAVVPGRGAQLRALSGRVVTYGMSPKDTLTLSSMDAAPLLCISREIIDLNGRRTEIQEIPLPADCSCPSLILPLCGVLLLSGAGAQELPSLLGAGQS